MNKNDLFIRLRNQTKTPLACQNKRLISTFEMTQIFDISKADINNEASNNEMNEF